MPRSLSVQTEDELGGALSVLTLQRRDHHRLDGVEQEHQEINELFAELERTDPDSPQHRRLFERIAQLLRHDARDEEDLLLPKLQEALDPRALRRAGLLWSALRYTAPTRPHPTVSRRPPGNALAALPLTGLDRARDRLDQAARRVPASLAAGCRNTSHVLASVAGAVEHLPLLRRGEHSTTRG